MSKSKGILLIAVGSIEYGKMAFNMALSIKDKNKEIKIALICDDESLLQIRKQNRWVFDQIIPVKESDYMESARLNPFKLKTFIYDYTPFDDTLYLDVDGLCIGNIDELFNRLQGSNFQMQEVGRYSKDIAISSDSVWTKANRGKGEQQLPKLWDMYKIDEKSIYPEYNSSFIWFKKNKECKKYFEKVKKLYDDRKYSFTSIGSFYPDEMAFGLASAMLNFYSTEEKFKAIFFGWEQKIAPLSEMSKSFTFLGMAGGVQLGKVVFHYDNIITALASKNKADIFKFKQRAKIYFHS